MIKERKNWLFALVLSFPMLLFFLCYYFNHDAGLIPTGFIQYDNVSYVAYARQYIDAEHFNFFYNNPFNDSAGYKAIYFQPQTLLFAFLLKLGIAPGAILIPFTLICSIICFRLLIAIYDHLFPDSKYRVICIWLLAWGGGLLAITGFFTSLFQPGINSIFVLDPGAGWWGLNFGRALFFSCEAYYHALFLGVIYALLKQKWIAAIITIAVLSMSHPFTGIELLAIVAAWAFIEIVAFRNKSIPAWFLIAIILIAGLHVYYYLYYLNQFADHRSVSLQYALNWRLRFFSMIPAYCLVGALALLTAFTFRRFLAAPPQRLFLSWFIIAFALANHEMFMQPMQPLHFTRGYVWTSLFLLGIPGLHYLLDRFNKTSLQKAVFIAFFALFFSDNLLWIFQQVNGRARESSTRYITKEQQEVFKVVSANANSNTLLFGNDEMMPYLGSVYTNGYPWIAHPYTTPFVIRKKQALYRYYLLREIYPAWKGRDLVFMIEKNELGTRLTIPGQLLIETPNYKVIKTRL